MELLVGCGRTRDRRIRTKPGLSSSNSWDELVTLDHNPDVNPDVVHDLEVLPYPFKAIKPSTWEKP